MSISRLSWVASLCVAMTAAVPGCKGDGDEAKDKDDKADEGGDKGEAKADDGEQDDAGSLKVASGDEGVDGPVPPETSMVFFSVEGALLPLACFDKAGGKIESGDKCLDLVPDGSTARVSSIDSEYNKPIGERTEPQCTAGDGKLTAFAVEGITEGANYKFGTWPPAGVKTVTPVSDATLDDSNLELSDDESAKLLAATGRSGELQAHQIAEIDLDGNDKKDKVYAVFIPDPKVIEQYAFSAIYLAADGNLDNLVELDKSKSKKDVYEVKGTLDLDGDGTKELWMRQVFAEGAGDAIFKVAGAKVERVGKYSCGA